MKAAMKDFHEYIVHDVLGHIDEVTSRQMFGGYALYQAGRVFALIINEDTVCFKGNEELRTQYESVGGEQFIYGGHTQKPPTPMPYWSVPESILEDREQISQWVATAAALSKPKK